MRDLTAVSYVRLRRAGVEPAGGQARGMGRPRPEGDRSRAGRTFFSSPSSHKYCCISLVTPKPCAAASSTPPAGPGLALTALPAFGGDFPRTTLEPRSPRGIQAPVLQPPWFRTQPAAAPGHPGSVPNTRCTPGWRRACRRSAGQRGQTP